MVIFSDFCVPSDVRAHSRKCVTFMYRTILRYLIMLNVANVHVAMAWLAILNYGGLMQKLTSRMRLPEIWLLLVSSYVLIKN
jgi:hypothetical protein